MTTGEELRSALDRKDGKPSLLLVNRKGTDDFPHPARGIARGFSSYLAEATSHHFISWLPHSYFRKPSGADVIASTNPSTL